MYSDWRTVGVDLSPYIGQTVRIKFETWDCGLGGHFGYAYLTAKCGEMKIEANACIPGNPVTLTAPEGFSYKWLPSGETTQSITISNAKLGDSVTVEMTSVTGCKKNLKRAVFSYPTADFVMDAKTCIDIPTQFTDMTGSPSNTWNWNFGDGTISTDRNPIHTYKKEGTYMVTLFVKTESGCEDSVSKSIYVCPNSGINEAAKKLNIHAYPNPTTGTFKMEVSEANIGTVQVAITNILGQVVYSENNAVKNGLLQKELDLKEQPDGVYFVSIQNKEYQAVIKLIKKN